MGGDYDNSHYTNISDENLKVVNELKSITMFILAYYPLLLFIIGIPSNILIIHIVSLSKMLRHNFVSVFLFYLSVFNMMNILIGLSRLWLIGMFSFDVRQVSIIVARVHSFLTMVVHMIANWILASLSICKLMYVLNPFIAIECCTRTMVHIFVLVIVVGATVFHYIITEGGKSVIMGSEKGVTGTLEENYLQFTRARALVQACVFFYIPDMLVHVLNFTTIALYTRTIRMTGNRSTKFRKHLEIARKYAVITLLIDVQSMVMEIPYALFFTERISWLHGDPVRIEKARLFNVMATMLLYTNYCTNFVVYCVFGRHYWHHLRRMCYPCFKRLLKPENKWLSTTSTSTVDSEWDVEPAPSIRKSLHATGSLKDLYQVRSECSRLSRVRSSEMSHSTMSEHYHSSVWMLFSSSSAAAAEERSRPSQTSYIN